MDAIREFAVREALPPAWADDAERFFLPLAGELKALRAGRAGPPLVGVTGAQGTGKSTLARLLTRLLADQGARAASLSLDDFYLSRAARRARAEALHPLFATRGVPGTHDTALLRATLAALRRADGPRGAPLPRFDKAADEPAPRDAWPRAEEPPALVLLEGWFVGAAPQDEERLAEPVNGLEAEEDPDGRWRRRVNRFLARDYAPAFEALDRLIVLQAPSFEQAFGWRALQERKLRASAPEGAAGLMDEARIERFVRHFERLTRHCLATLPARADIVFELDPSHRVKSRTDRRRAPRGRR